MDPITARRVLRIVPDSPLTVELVERAYAGEAWERHPSRYTDPSARRDAEEWAQTLATARGVLLTQAQWFSAPRADATTTPSPRRRLAGGAIAGLVAGGVALIALVMFGVVAAASLLTETITTATEELESEASDAASGDAGSGSGSGPGTGSGDTDSDTDGATELADVERYTAEEMLYTFPAAVELYNDGRHSDECSIDYVQGCWQAALFTEADCDAMEIGLAFTNDINAILPDHRDTIAKQHVVANEATVVVFGNDEYAYGWIDQVTCLDAV